MLLCQDISHSYAERVLFDKLNFTLDKGKHLLITGASGSGKTTLLALLTGMMKPQNGVIAYDDLNIATLEDGALDKFRGQHIGIVFQDFHLIPVLSVWQNVALALSLAQKPVEDARIMDVLSRLKLAEKVKDKVQNLSLGEKQRAALARAVVGRPAWIFCDEPTSALDDANTHAMLELLQTEASVIGASLITVTHDARVKADFSHHQSIMLGA